MNRALLKILASVAFGNVPVVPTLLFLNAMAPTLPPRPGHSLFGLGRFHPPRVRRHVGQTMARP